MKLNSRSAAIFLVMTALCALPLRAGTVVESSGEMIAVAQGDRSRLTFYDERGAEVWSTTTSPTPKVIRFSNDGKEVVVLDSVQSEVTQVDLTRRTSNVIKVPATPIEAVWLDDTAYILCRDAEKLVALRKGRVTAEIDVPADPLSVRTHAARLYVYSRLQGEITVLSRRLELQNRFRVAPFASDFELDQTYGYLVIPRRGALVSFRLEGKPAIQTFAVGAVPVDLSIDRGKSALKGTTLLIADPASKRIWREEGTQSMSEAVGRGFVRGLLGLGLYRPASLEYPTGVDRIARSGNVELAYDSSSRTVYLAAKNGAIVLARNVAAQGYAAAGERLWYWDESDRKLRSTPLRIVRKQRPAAR